MDDGRIDLRGRGLDDAAFPLHPLLVVQQVAGHRSESEVHIVRGHAQIRREAIEDDAVHGVFGLS